MNDGSFDKRIIILEAARRIFKRFGYTKTAISDIAKEAGIGKGTIYYYFKSKEDIFLELLNKESYVIMELLKNKVDSNDCFEEKLRYFIMGPLYHIKENSEEFVNYIKEARNVFLTKVREFDKKFDEFQYNTMIEILNQARNTGCLNKCIKIKETATLLIEWFELAEDRMVEAISEGRLDEVLSNHEKMIKLLLFGLIKREVIWESF